MKKVTDIVEYLSLLMELEKTGLETKSLQSVLSFLYSDESGKYKDTTFAVPFYGKEQVAVLTPNIFPSIFGGIQDVERVVSVMSISHFNFSFMTLREMYVLIEE